MVATARFADALHTGNSLLGRNGPVPAAAGDRSSAASSGARTVRCWALLVLAAPAAAEVWSGWTGIARKTGFGLVPPLPGIWPSLHLDTTITLPVGVEAYAAYALRAWLAREDWISDQTRRFAKWSAICSFALGMAGQVAYHLLAQAGAARAPWPVTTLVSCLPAGPGPGHGDRAGPHAGRRRSHRKRTDRTTPGPEDRQRPGPPARTRTVPDPVHGIADRTRTPTCRRSTRRA